MSAGKDILTRTGAIIRKRASRRFRSNVEFADVCNISESTVRRILMGKQNISLKVLEKICSALGIKPSELLKESGF